MSLIVTIYHYASNIHYKFSVVMYHYFFPIFFVCCTQTIHWPSRILFFYPYGGCYMAKKEIGIYIACQYVIVCLNAGPWKKDK